MRFRKLTGVLLAAVLCVGGWITAANCVACPFCAGAMMTLSEQYAKADAVTVVEWQKAREASEEEKAETTFKLVEVLRDTSKELKAGQVIAIDRYRAGKPGDRSVLMGTKLEKMEWADPLLVSAQSLDYIRKAPSLDAAPADRLAYYVQYFENEDQTVANDAYAEFANAPYKEILTVTDKLPRDKLRLWVLDPDIPQTRLGLYGLLLGLSGDETDADRLEQKIVATSDTELRLGIDGVMGGYLLLKGEPGLAVIEKTKFTDPKTPFSETYAGMQALRFMWQYGNGRISKERLKQSMRLLLDRPELADLVITDLSRWKDWSVQDRLRALYGVEGYNVPSVKRAIVRFLFACSKDLTPTTDKNASVPEHVKKAKKHIEDLRKIEPRLVDDVERFLY